MNLQLIAITVKSEDPVDKFLALDAELRDNNFYGEVVLKYEAGVPRRVLVTESIKL